MRWFRSAKHLFQSYRFWDTFFAYCSEELVGLRTVLKEIATFRIAPKAAKTRRTYQPEIEGLEIRQMPATVQFLTPSRYVLESASSAAVTVTLNPSTAFAQVDYTTVDGTAFAGLYGDYTATSGTLTFLPGQSSKTISVPLQNTPRTADVDFSVILTLPSGATLGTPDDEEITIHEPPVTNNDSYYGMSGLALDVPATSGVLANDYDPGSGALTATLVSGPSNGTLNLNTDGSFSYAPTGTPTTDSFVYSASDGAMSTDATANLQFVADTASAGPMYDDPTNAAIVPIGETNADVGNGSVQVNQPLDFDLSPGTDVGGNPALVYNSATVYVRPVIQVSLDTDSVSLPEDIQLQLTWNGTTQSPVTYTPGGSQNPGDTLVMAVQPDSAVAQTGLYDWTVDVELDYPTYSAFGTIGGSSRVVVQNSSVSGQVDPYGAGWSIAGIDRLVPINGGVIWVDGTGDSSFFADDGMGGYTNPAGNFGTLVPTPDGYTVSSATESGSTVTITTSSATDFSVGEPVEIAGITPSGYDGVVTVASMSGTTFTYTADSGLGTATLSSATATGHTWSYSANGVVQEEDFNQFGMETKVVGIDNLTRSYAYDSGNRLTQEISGDGGTTALAYDSSGFLTAITEPGGRTIDTTQSVSGGVADLTQIVDGAGYTRNFGYDAENHLISDSWEPYATEFAYDSGSGLFDAVNLGSGSSYEVVSAAEEPLQSGTPIEAAENYQATITDGLGNTTLYQLDSSDRMTEEFSPVSYAESITAASWASGTPATATITASNSFEPGQSVVIAGIQSTGSGSYDGTFTILTATSTNFTYALNTDPGTLDYSSVTAATWASNTATITAANTFSAGQTVTIAGVTPSGYDGAFTILSASSSGFTYTLSTNPGGAGTAFGSATVVTATIVAGPMQHWSFNTSDLLTSYTDQDGNETSYGYDSYGQLTAQANPDGSATIYYRNATVYDDITKTVENGVITTTAAYNSSGEMTASVDADGYITTYGWSGNRMTGTVDPDFGVTQFAYDSNLRLTKSVDADGNTSLTAYDSSGNISTTTDGDGYTTDYTYDDDNNLTGQTNPAGDSSSYTFDAAGFQTVSVSDGVTSTSAFDTRGWMTKSVDGDGNTTLYAYDPVGNVTATTDPRGYTSLQQFDAEGNATAVIDADGGTTLQFFDLDGNVTKSVNPDNGTTLYNYDGDGNLVSTTDPDGFGASTTYDTDGRVTATSDGAGDGTHTYYDKNSNVTASVDGRSYTTSMFYDDAGNLTKTVDPLGDTTLQFYDHDGNVTATVDPDNKTSYQFYDHDGDVTESLDADSHATFFYYDHDDRLTKTVDPDGHTSITAYDSRGNISGTTDGAGHSTSTGYDNDGNPTSSTDGAGDTSQQFYDADGDVTKSIDGDGDTSLQYYDPDDLLTKTVDGAGHTTINFYDSADFLTATSDGNGQTTLYVNDPAGNATQIIDPLGHTTLQSFDGDGRITKSVDPDHKTSTVAYDGDGNEVGSTDGAGNGTSEQFDHAGQLTWSSDGAGDTMQQQYDPAGNVTWSSDGDGKTTVNFYDSADNLTKSINPDNGTTLNSYDPANNLTETTDPAGHSMQMFYDGDGQVTKTIDGDGNTELTAYDGDGRVISSTDPAGNTSTNSYDGNGNVTASTDGAGRASTSAYDNDGNVTQAVANGVTTLMQYDADNNQTASSIYGSGGSTYYGYNIDDELTSVTDPDGNVTSYTLDADGNQTQAIDPNGYTTQQSFDGDDRLTQRVTPDGGTINFTYDGDGRTLSNDSGTFVYDGDGNILTASNSSGSYVFSYDYDDRLTQVSEPFGVTLDFAYDADGNRTQVIDSFGGTQLSSYDSSNFLTELTYSGESEQIRIDFTNNGDGMPTTITRYSDLAGTTLVATTDEGYDGDGNITSVYTTDSVGNPLQSYTYAYNSSDQLTAQVENGDAASFTYDSAGQLLSGDGISYGYDSNGNRNTGSDAVTTGNEMSADANWNYTYDKEGDLTEKQSTGSSASWTYAYNASSELTEVKQYGSTGTLVQTVDYSYDAFGEEIEQDVTPAGSGTTETKFAYDGWNPNMPAGTGNANFVQWAVLNGDNSLQSRNINGNTPGSHLARVDQTGASDPSGVYYLLSDRQDSVRDVINASGSSVDAINYDAYGNITAGETDPSYRGRYAWSGQEFDAQTDLQYNNARWYDATTGRWISQDPMGFDAGDSNLYRYVNNAPTNAMDPSGLQRANAMPATADDTIGRAGELLIVPDNSHLAEEALLFKPDGGRRGRGPDAVFALFTKVLSSGVASNVKANKFNGYEVKAGENVNDFASLAKVIMMEYKANGNKKFKAITIYGHNGGGDAKLAKGAVDPGKQYPGVALGQKDLVTPAKGSLGNSGNGLRFDLASVSAWKAKSGLSKALETALEPGGYIRIAACGYRFDPSVNAAKWGESVDLMAKELGFPVWVSEGMPDYDAEAGNFMRLKTNNGVKDVDTKWYKATPPK